MKKIFIISPEQRKIPVSIIRNGCCEEKAFPHILPACKLGFFASLDIPISLAWYFSQKILINNLHQMPIKYFLPGLCMSSTTCVNQ